ncbi:hypothetical protein DFH05DRAFT_489490 [Lentinula detonsa]|uniref:Uncharacterized protein n=1 Tax=Lentinula detonsa TaxID=2804962 RepID=A0A9W8NS14_9AGAR|nr:hypothetical protein DFH05DRAFT_489490 [Lentinula detonsa]
MSFPLSPLFPTSLSALSKCNFFPIATQLYFGWSNMKDNNKPPRYLSDGRHNPALERKGPPKHIPLTLPPLRKQCIRVHPRQVALPPIAQFLQMTFASRYYADPNDLPPAFFLQVSDSRKGQSTAGHTKSVDSQENTYLHQSRPLPPKFQPDHRIWNLLRMTNYYLPDDLYHAIITGQHPEAVSNLIVKLEADYRQRKTHPTSCYDLPNLCSDPSHPIWDLLPLTDYDLPDEARDAINECRPLAQIREICGRLLKVWREKRRDDHEY